MIASEVLMLLFIPQFICSFPQNKKKVCGIYILCMHLFMSYKGFNRSKAIKTVKKLNHVHTELVVHIIIRACNNKICISESESVSAHLYQNRIGTEKKWIVHL